MNDLQSVLAEIEQMTRKATEGPWSSESDWPRVYAIKDRVQIPVCQCVSRLVERTKGPTTPNTAFIAASRTLVPALVKALKEALEEIQYVAECDDIFDRRKSVKRLESELAAILTDKEGK